MLHAMQHGIKMQLKFRSWARKSRPRGQEKRESNAVQVIS